MDLYKRIRDQRIKQGMSQNDLAKKTGYSDRSSIAKIEAGKVDLTNTKISEFAKALGVSPAYLMGWDTSLEPIDFPEMVPIPVLGCIHAGDPVTAQECVEDVPLYIPKDWTESGQLYRGLRVKGNSMQPRIQEGDRVIFRVTPDCESGDIVIARIDGEDATVKRIVKGSGIITLQPLNPDFAPIVFTGDDAEPTLEILGVVVQLVRDM